MKPIKEKNQTNVDPEKVETKHTRYDEKRKNLSRLPSSRIKDKSKAQGMEDLYALDEAESKLNMIADAALFALKNKAEFKKFRENLNKS
jgi:hypothetical protein